MSNVVNGTEKFVSVILQMITKGSFNDVKIILEDGEIDANIDVLSARCDYFATCFSKVKFIEGATKRVVMSHCSERVMEKIIHYLFSGKIELQDLSLTDLIKMMNMASMMLLDDLLAGIQKFVLGFLPDSGVHCGSLPGIMEGLMLAEQFKLEKIKDPLIVEVYRSLKDVPHIPDVVNNSETFKDLPVNLLKDVLFHDEEVEVDVCEVCVDTVQPTTKEKFDAFVFWLSENECTNEEKMLITNRFHFDHFTGEELLTDIKKSGLYSTKTIDDRVMEILKQNAYLLNSQAESIKFKDRKLLSKRKEVNTLKVEVKRLKEDLYAAQLLKVGTRLSRKGET